VKIKSYDSDNQLNHSSNIFNDYIITMSSIER
jgi:hypothetical protein